LCAKPSIFNRPTRLCRAAQWSWSSSSSRSIPTDVA
jgi:hypothetical protein